MQTSYVGKSYFHYILLHDTRVFVFLICFNANFAIAVCFSKLKKVVY